MTDCPLPDDEITGFTTQGNPIPFVLPLPTIAAFNSGRDAAKRYAEVGKSSVSAASRRRRSRFIVNDAARAFGMTSAAPLCSKPSSTSVAIASISGTMMCGLSCSISLLRATGFHPEALDHTTA